MSHKNTVCNVGAIDAICPIKMPLRPVQVMSTVSRNPRRAACMLLAAATMLTSRTSEAGGFLGIDHRWGYDNAGIWARSNQTALLYSMVGAELACGLWWGGEDRVGNTCWRAIDSSIIASGSAQALKYAFTRARPIQDNNPNLWFQGGTHYSFPSGEVATVSSIVSPFIFQYRFDQMAVWLLELLPLYDGLARMKVQAHWQTDVLFGWLIGTASGYYAYRRNSPLVLSVMPHGIYVGLKREF
jgi:membrane-associated phospholipid phosphatase